ncbi:M56 family metallopeptidase [uncultured Psychroserpens sp.]|uniref:M56 family metallopeptidase n=1 Tax=uncultured Psychroserpens sp. TaxID=255436 RepID=UPI00261EB8B9|nr:M56 family metallopeptidase [uncultured Psychroserpens sp.]
MLHYILQVIAFQLVFLIIYDAFLRTETFFNANRAYLLITAVFSVVLPFIKIEQIKTVVAEDFVIRLPEVIIGNTTETIASIDPQIAMQAGINLEPEPVSIWTIILVSGMCLATLLLLFKISKLLWIAHKYPKRWKGNLLIIELLNSTKAFSFFHYIFLGGNLKSEERTSILEHEMIHVKQKHTLDLLFFEVFRIVFWFNPLIYMYQNRIATLHEYIADAKAVKQNNKTDYYNNLLSQVFETEQFSFVNPFFKHSLIKKRILMLSKSKSKQIHMLKYALLIPMVFTMLIYTSSYAQEKQITSTSETVNQNSQELSDEALFNKYYNEIIELDNNRVEFDNIYNSYKANIDKYILIREDYYKNAALFKFIFSKRAIQLEEDSQLDEIDRELMERFSKFKPYLEYLEYKKTDKAKLKWENNAKAGQLRMVFNDTGNWTDQEEKEFKEKLDLIEKDNAYKELLTTSVNGRSTMKVHDVKSNNTTASSNEETKIIDTNVEIPFSTVDEVPIFSFCEDLTTEEERRTCVSKAIATHVNKKFNTKLAEQLGLVGRQRINVIFKIDKNGYVTGAKSRAPHPELEKEAVRVINTLPRFIAGKQKGVPVTVPYSLPIIFQVQGKTNQFKALEDSKTKKGKEATLKEVLKTSVNSQMQTKEIPFMRVDEVPMYESCVGLTSQKDKKACVSKEISKFVNKNFNLNLASELKIVGRQNISVIFKIDELGYVKYVKARASHPDLEKEAIRVIKALPKLIPGKHEGKPVTVLYSLPITFQIASDTNKDKKN